MSWSVQGVRHRAQRIPTTDERPASVKLAHLLPISLIGTTPANQSVHLTLAPLVMMYPRYTNWLRRRMINGDTVILDNPVHEDVEPNLDIWMQAMELLHPTIAILPDVIDDDQQTVTNAVQLAKTVKRHWDQPVQLMAVPHGIEQADWNVCARALGAIPEIDWLGISLERRLKDDELAVARRFNRLKFIRETQNFDRIRVHLLGTSERSSEFRGGHVWRRAESIDSSKFAVFYLTNQPVSPPGPVSIPYPGRAPFGGSMEYFHAIPKLPLLGKGRLTQNLAAWCTYAERSRTQ